MRFRQFMDEYETVRAREGRGSDDPRYYLALPYADTTGRNSWQWKVRAGSFRYLERHILPQLEREHPHRLDVLDIGAGNCWLSYRLALRGHRPVAVDLLVNDQDGLGAAPHYLDTLPVAFPRFQAEMDRLPLAPQQFDLAIFNASFHYSQDYPRTLEETVRCLRPAGHLLIIDTPFYLREESGQQMVRARREMFERVHGFRSDSIPSREFLVPEILENLARSCGICWKVLKPWHGLGWAVRPLQARLLGRREPSKFYIFWGVSEPR